MKTYEITDLSGDTSQVVSTPEQAEKFLAEIFEGSGSNLLHLKDQFLTALQADMPIEAFDSLADSLALSVQLAGDPVEDVATPARYATPAARLVCRADAPREQWLKARKTGLGASDASKIIGLSKWGDAFSVWADKTGRAPEVEDNEAMYWGRAIEPLLRTRFTEETGIKVRQSGMLRSKDHHFLLYTPDGLTADGGLLECKTFGQWVENEWVNEDGSPAVPDHAYSQVQQGLLVTGRSHAWIVGLGSGRNWFIRRVERDQAMMDLILKQAEYVWDCVENDVEPPVGQYAAEVLDHLHPTGEGVYELDSAEDEGLAEQALALRAAYRLAADKEKEGKDEKANIRAKILQLTGDNEQLNVDREKLWTMKNTSKFSASTFQKLATPEQLAEVSTASVRLPLVDPAHAIKVAAVIEEAYDRLLETEYADPETGEATACVPPTVEQQVDADKVAELFPDLHKASRSRVLLVAKPKEAK